jgi:hypothetical protein
LASAFMSKRSPVRERLLASRADNFVEGLRALGGGRAVASIYEIFAGHSNACRKTLPQPQAYVLSMPPLSTVPLSRKGVLPPPPPSLGATFCQQAHLHHSTAGLATPPCCSADYFLPPAARALSTAHPTCCGHLVLEVNNLVNTTSSS